MKIDWFTFAAQMINFGLLVYLLHRFLYGPITAAMNQREETIASRLRMADEQQRAAQDEAERFRQQSERLEHQREEMFERARSESEEARRSLISQAREEVQARRDDWLKSLQREQKSLINLVRQRAGDQVVAVSRGALSQLADVELEERILETFLVQLSQLPEEQASRLKMEASSAEQAHIHTAFEVGPPWKKKILDMLQRLFGFEGVGFQVNPDLVCGIELHVGGSKIGWSMQEYLESLTDELQGLLVAK